MFFDKLLNSKYAQIKNIFFYGLLFILFVSVCNIIYAIITNNYSPHFFSFLFSSITIVICFINSILCLRSYRKNSKIRFDLIGILFTFITCILVIIYLWSDFKFLQKTIITSFIITLTYTTAILPLSLFTKKLQNSKLLYAILLIHRFATPLFGLSLIVNFIFDIRYEWLLKSSWILLLIEIFVVTALFIIHIKSSKDLLILKLDPKTNLYQSKDNKFYRVEQVENNHTTENISEKALDKTTIDDLDKNDELLETIEPQVVKEENIDIK